ncbi:unnamed protein product [Darwinula stevensoni]|uniref:Vang-like protein n=1 Tax=Darwinula stevensoni TaxID=69355 RepID=A0A7R8X9J1_9CRUS|nr:unnamed protein product [Darwinula stevensoni]CAG0884588.1 unnamed protein product [Darwinula stevensoni]
MKVLENYGEGGETTTPRMPYIFQESHTTTWSHALETESVKSNGSDLPRRPRVHRFPNQNHINYNHTNHHPQLQLQHQQNHVPSRSQSRQSNRSVSVRSPLPSKDGFSSGLNSPLNTTLSMVPEDRPEGQEVIEVQILPQDENWGDNTTAVTGNTSEGGSMEDLSKWMKEPDTGLSFHCQRWSGFVFALVLSVVGFLSPIVMVVIPKTGLYQISPTQLKCGPECDGALISLTFKLLILLVGCWAVFLRKPRATTPRIYTLRALVLLVLFVLIFSYWLFYCVRLIETFEDDIPYYSVVLFADSMVNSLLFVHYITVVLMEIRHQQTQYVIKVVRSPDGEARSYPIGQLSIQRAAVAVLEKYYLDFPLYNPYLERLPTAKSKKMNQLGSSSNGPTSFKFYDVDGFNGGIQGPGNVTGSGRRRDSSHNERFYEEHEYERRVKKRRARLLTATEEAFMHIKRVHQDQGMGGGSSGGTGNPMDPGEAAQAVFPTLARPLQKYLRITRQQPWHTMDGILSHLSTSLSHDLSPKAFLEKYLTTAPIMQYDREKKEVQTWALVCDVLLSRQIKDGTMFQLRQNDLSLICTVTKLPHFNVTEEIIDPKSNRFVIRLNSETSV